MNEKSYEQWKHDCVTKVTAAIAAEVKRRGFKLRDTGKGFRSSNTVTIDGESHYQAQAEVRPQSSRYGRRTSGTIVVGGGYGAGVAARTFRWDMRPSSTVEEVVAGAAAKVESIVDALVETHELFEKRHRESNAKRDRKREFRDLVFASLPSSRIVTGVSFPGEDEPRRSIKTDSSIHVQLDTEGPLVTVQLRTDFRVPPEKLACLLDLIEDMDRKVEQFLEDA